MGWYNRLLFFVASHQLVLAENRLLDKSQPKIDESKILDKWVSDGKYRHYTLQIMPWKGQGEPISVTVSMSLYDDAYANDKIRMYTYKGAFNIPWRRIALP
jgi:hypothetical protein